MGRNDAMQDDDHRASHPSPNGRAPDAPVDEFNAWLDALVDGGDGCAARDLTGDGARLGETARRLQALATGADRRGASEALMERTWEAIMAERFTLNAAPSAASNARWTSTANHGAWTRAPSLPAVPPRTGRLDERPRLWRSVERWQAAISTTGVLVLLLTLIAGFAASRDANPPRGGGDGQSRLAAVGTAGLEASPAAASASCTVEPLSVEEIQRIDRLPPEFPPRSYTPTGKADAVTAIAVLAVVQEKQACAALSSFHEYALGTDRYVWESSSMYWRERVSESPVPPETTFDRIGDSGDNKYWEHLDVTIDRVVEEFILDDGEVRPEVTALAWWRTPHVDRVSTESSFQPEDVFVLADGRVAALWGDLEDAGEPGQNVYRIPQGLYRFAAFRWEDERWHIDEEIMFATSR